MAPSSDVIDIPCNGAVNCIECSPFEFCDSLLCFSSYVNSETGPDSYHITIAKLHPKREGNSMLEVLKEYNQDRFTTSLCWSPKTLIESLPYEAILCAGSIDGKVNLITTDLRENSAIETVGAHSKAVNAVCFDYTNGDLLASVGDDYRCILWNTQTNNKSFKTKHQEFPLKSAGMDVRFNHHDSSKLAVAERSGLIRLYDIVTLTAFMSVECSNGLILKSIDWSADDITRIDALTGSDWLTFDTSRSCLPSVTKPLEHCDIVGCATRIRMSPSTPALVAVSYGKGSDVRVIASPSSGVDTVVQHVSGAIGSGFAWHLNQPLLVCGGDNRLRLVICDTIS